MYTFRQLVHVGLWLSLAVGIFLLRCNARAGAVPSPSSFEPKLAAVNVAGTSRFKSEDVLAAIGLSVGQTIAETDLKKALQYLQQCGAFSEVVYSQEALPTGIHLNFHLTDSEHFVPVLFDNIVWFSDEELLKELHRRVPLFRGALPLVGTLAQQVSDALQALLVERRLPHHVAYSQLEFGPADIGQWTRDNPSTVVGVLTAYIRVDSPAVSHLRPTEVFEFHVTGPAIRMRNIGIRGAQEPELTELRTAAKDLLVQTYSRRTLRTLTEQLLVPVYLRHGYIRAIFADAQGRLAHNASDETVVDVTLSVEPGKQYRWAGIEWSGVSVFPVETLNRYIHLRTGRPADIIHLQLDLDMIVTELYHRGGYVAVRTVAYPQIDDQHSTVRYEVRIEEGVAYRVGKLEIEGLDAPRAAKVAEKLKLHSGDVYNSIYFALDSMVRNWSSGRKVIIEQTRNDQEKTVDIRLSFG